MKAQHGFSLIAVLMVSAACGLTAQSPGDPTINGKKVLAEVNGVSITEEQVVAAAASQLEELETRRLQNEANLARDKHTTMSQRLNEEIDGRLLDAEAGKRGVTRDALLDAEVAKKAPVPTDAEVEDFYEKNKNRIRVPKEQALGQVRDYLADERQRVVFGDFMARLRKDYGVKMFLEPHRSTVQTSGHPSLGPATAPVTLVEFSDFECPFCANLFSTLKRVEKAYEGKIKVVFRQFPLTSIHPNAQKAAEASLCANDQKKFWEMHDSLFEAPKDLGVDAIKARATRLQLDVPAFAACLDSNKYAEQVRLDLLEGSRLGVTGTPAIFVNGRFLSGAQPFEEIAKVIEEELRGK